jgi:hypothetical protein
MSRIKITLVKVIVLVVSPDDDDVVAYVANIRDHLAPNLHN